MTRTNVIQQNRMHHSDPDTHCMALSKILNQHIEIHNTGKAGVKHVKMCTDASIPTPMHLVSVCLVIQNEVSLRLTNSH